ncbi:lysylphosphatidylglycerol synthase transmembrane domain-containing protein [Lysobacter auxotrophicus]|uniref:Flippase-like domain-containing protein n=1 Tax=Lysobacter auxotrophicus TaxID=2992573 RepID=A0ABM8DFV5_9GAMM|nr:lysylphosphatidylglycerol synthase transmembrane domain-containing protein [Lysobacter auxotrophicus]BDU17485.1 flippase-like domain-containing protein [Lysobacter auxotrophicus]
MNDATKDGRISWGRHLVGLVATLGCLYLLSRQVKLQDVLDAVRHFHWPYLVLGISSLAAGYVLRIWRWRMLLRAAGARASFRECTAPFLGSIALNNVLPLRLGDVLRALVFPTAMGLTRTLATSSLVMERLVDLMTLLASLTIGLFAIRTVVVPEGLQQTAVSLAIVGGLALVLGLGLSARLGTLFNSMANRRAHPTDKLSRLYRTVGELLHGFAAMARPGILAQLVLISMAIWAFESGLFYFILVGLSIPATPTVALLVMSIATLATLAPSSPGYVGPFHLAAFAAVSLVGGSAAQAGSYAVIVHLALWLPSTIAGAIALSLRPELFRSARQKELTAKNQHEQV